MTATAPAWLRDYALLALRVNRQVMASSGGPVLIYWGPEEWSALAEAEEPPPPGRLVEDADRLLEDLPREDRARAAFLAAQVRALRAAARRLDGQAPPLAEAARESLGIEAGRVPESVFEAAHAQLDAALPRGGGSLAERLHAWQRAHSLPPERSDRLPELVGRAVAETRARTSTIVPLPDDEVVDCQLVPEGHFLAAGHHAGGRRSTVFINRSLPFNLADLLYVVAHEGHPGHIAESLLKEIHLAERRAFPEAPIRFLLSPPFVLGEGLGLHAEAIVFPDDQAQTWLTEHVLSEEGIRPDGSDFAAIHDAKNALWGVWANAAFMVSEGRRQDEVADYLARWALYDQREIAATLRSIGGPGMGLYVLGYYHGWRLVGSWLDAPDRHRRVRRLLTEQLLPADLEADLRPAGTRSG